ncbi:hypothetical protein [Lactococcus fujiensis]|uniref:hypothetical protein n=1 Tax=Lactococcus fujiensis TaxID=610251 RepID=UPI0006D16AF1|nr:hypothetical protein [Lactococcus fujiensis]
MKYLVSDLIERQPLQRMITSDKVLYTIIPKFLLLRYIDDPKLRQEIKNLYKLGKVINPTLNKNDKSLKRTIYQYLSMLKQVKKIQYLLSKINEIRLLICQCANF